MADDNPARLPHIFLHDTSTTHQYTRPGGGRGRKLNLPDRDRSAHANKLLQQLETIRERENQIADEQRAFGIDAGWGMYLSFESEPDFDIKFESLEFGPSGIELCSVKQQERKTITTVFVPEGKLVFFLKRITQYRDENTATDKPKHKDLIEGVSNIREAALEALWTDDIDTFPQDGDAIWWEVWLRESSKVDYEAFIRGHLDQMDLEVKRESLHFLDRSVLLVRGTSTELSQSVYFLGAIAEVRKGRESADFFTGMDKAEQDAWIDEALGLIEAPPQNAPYVCLLDTGTTDQHPLLAVVCDPTDMHSYDPAWGTDDRYGHGTQMAGISIYDDLTHVLASNEPIQLSHRIESVKITPNPEHHDDPQLFGAITKESIARVEVHPNRRRVFSMAVSAKDSRHRGKPSSWSAAVDALASGSSDGAQRLVLLSAGNTDYAARRLYPDSNFTDSIHDPGQAWNALTVGAFTTKVDLNNDEYPGWTPLAPAGDLSPSSCTSSVWANVWPIKPDFVMEGGNMGLNPVDGTADYIDDRLQLLTTSNRFALGNPLESFGDTSAAVASAARLSAMVMAEYPEYWPETIRGLLVHSSRWTAAMKSRFAPLNLKSEYRQMLRYCGWGAPDLQELFWSAQDALTLVAQESIQPYFRDGQTVKTRDINLHEIPWPVDVLQELEDAPVEMRVTLSYFIEPNPGERGWATKYRYASHGLRFDAKRPLEAIEDFQRRINQQARDEDYSQSATQESGEWALGERLRSLGSIHSDIWTGTAAELAERGHVAVYPVIGWWKERHQFERFDNVTRYSLLVSIRTPTAEVELYSAIENQIAVAVEV